ncbi:MAG: hypothetical protein FWB93_00510 [Oscillospiraceae bacterium]|nr:hypothetical protein [Oscillospiraceae bacterium]
MSQSDKEILPEKLMPTPKIAIVGGDKRQLHLARYLAAMAEVSVYGILPQDNYWVSSEFATPYSLATTLKGASAVFLPIPFSRDGVTVNTALWEEKIPLKEVLSLVRGNDIDFFAGLCTPDFAEAVQTNGCTLYDYGLDESIAGGGALPTAEAALALAINETSGLICGSRVAVLGSGRIAVRLAYLLSAVGADVTLCARRDLGISGGKYVPLTHLSKAIHGREVIFNTIPAPTLTPSMLAGNDGSLIIDLASPVQGQEFPVGITREETTAAGVRIIHALGLPGKCAPKYSGELLGKYALERIKSIERKNGT